MADWTDQDPATLLPGKAWTSAKAIAAFENVEAQAEGASGAPKQRGKSLDTFLYQGTLSGATTDLTDLNETSVRVDFGGLYDSGAGTGTLGIRFSNDNGLTYTSETTLFTLLADGIGAGYAFVNLSTGLYRSVASTGLIVAGTFAVPSGVNAIRLRTSPSEMTLSLVVTGVGEFG